MGRRKNERKRSQGGGAGEERGKSKQITRKKEVYREEWDEREKGGRENYIFRHFRNFNLTLSNLEF